MTREQIIRELRLLLNAAQEGRKTDVELHIEWLADELTKVAVDAT